MSTDFSSLDKLVEFGLGIGIATQMMNTMNRALAKTSYPGVGINPGISPIPAYSSQQPFVQEFYIVKDEKLAGPLTGGEIEQLVKNEVITPQTLCWHIGLEGWKTAEDIPEINKYFLLNL